MMRLWLVGLMVACGPPSAKRAPRPVDSDRLAKSEIALLRDQPLRIEARIVASGAVAADVEVVVVLAPENRLRFTAHGTFGGNKISLHYTSDGTNTSLGGPTPPALDRAVIIGMTRMGLLHNVAVLLANKDPDHAVGGVEQWVKPIGLRPAPPRTSPAANTTVMRFGIEVAGKRSGTADVWFDDTTELPTSRVQTVTFAAGSMTVKESYKIVTSVSVSDADFRSAGACQQNASCLLDACTAGDMNGCERYAAALYFGAAVTRNERQAAKFWRRACKRGHAGACAQKRWSEKRAHRDPGKGAAMRRLSQTACHAGVNCRWLANAAKTWDQRRAILDRACERGMQPECMELGEAFEHGHDGAPRDREAALSAYRRACRGDITHGCRKAFSLLKISGKKKEAAALALDLCKRGATTRAFWCWNAGSVLDPLNRPLAYSLGCRAGDAKSCSRLAMAHQTGKGVRRDPALALELYRRACKGNNTMSCWRAATLDPKQAPRYWSQACSQFDKPACWAAGEAYRLGRGVAKSPSKAMEHYATGCLEGDLHACFVRARMIERGIGAKRDRAEASMKYRELCGVKGSHQACVSAARLTRGNKKRKTSLCRAACKAWKNRDRSDKRLSSRNPGLAPACRVVIKRCQ